ncbi:hypothetical protein RRG08_001941 [Elysia crispata]|uniref:Uncharacterized protein n=1 Tax=Elysia crispata TaxID=231223 RepID=A0AAE1EE66_9GAST|nr:hypothetical protein RRG08_001941 [Elysia crispata]
MRRRDRLLLERKKGEKEWKLVSVPLPWQIFVCSRQPVTDLTSDSCDLTLVRMECLVTYSGYTDQRAVILRHCRLSLASRAVNEDVGPDGQTSVGNRPGKDRKLFM